MGMEHIPTGKFPGLPKTIVILDCRTMHLLSNEYLI